MEDRMYIVGGAIAALLIIAFVLWKLKKLNDMIMSLIHDTLKRNGKWSRTSLTMCTAWTACLISYTYDFIKNGFNFEAFTVLVGVALGAKVTDGWAKKLDPLVQPTSNGEVKQDAV